MTPREQTKAIKSALVKAGYTHPRVRHGTARYPAWLDIEVSVPEPFSHQWRADHHNRIGKIVRSVTGEHGDPVGQVSIIVGFVG